MMRQTLRKAIKIEATKALFDSKDIRDKRDNYFYMLGMVRIACLDDKDFKEAKKILNNIFLFLETENA